MAPFADLQVYDALDEPIGFEARRDMLFSSDTVVAFDPETYEEKVEITHKELRAEDFPRLRLVQNWYWDDRQRRLVIHLQSFAPVISVYDLYRGNFLYERPLFYRRKK